MNTIFLEIECLTDYSKSLSSEYLRKNWFKKADKRYMSQYLQKFIEYNRSYFNFLGVTAYIEGTDPNVSLIFKSSEFIGAIPLRSPDTGKQIGDFIVSPRYASKDKLLEYIKILNLIEKSVNAEFKNSIPLLSGRNFQPPFYYEAVIYIKLLSTLVKNKWVKFSNEETIKQTPTGQINLNKYIQNEFKIEQRLKFPVNKNILTEYHNEYGNLTYVFNLCKKENYQSLFPPRELCGDNAAMIALVGLEKYKLKQFDNLDYPAKPRWQLDKDAAFLKGAGVKL
jgi:hypothetical protein